MPRTFALLISMTLSLTALAPALQAKKHHEQTAVFAPDERRIITQYFRGRYSNLPPGLAKRRGELPPGLQKHIRQTGHLPPGLERRIQPFPYELDRRLSPLPSIFRRGMIGDRAVIYDASTMAIRDMIDILTGARR